ncbi:hypothetical protein K875_00003 [Mycobacterium [tuberculosis] TKK-01-0051]|uniref:AB hydrolase-1 domain-containing protein n=1 Tax=Mycobacterium [tuberculosis] TKK-01-0051 TaxID=1324261 RepID=A0A051UJY3_9MYCO|nr:alpha/beta hydrolase [Mycobacterium colombiense]KBZ69288.1 hypothetical protein K875_00003 [Mycobacterium [tuberculosis] TKK-01-0051]
MSTAAPEENFVDAGRVTTRYWETGAGEPLVLIHGGGAGADAWGNWAPSLSAYAERFRTMAYDMVGFGKSRVADENFEYSQQSRIDHLAAFLDALGLDRVSLIGNSMGGATALGLAMTQPLRINRLVLMGSAGLNRRFSPQLQTILNYQEPDRDAMARIVAALTHESFVAPEDLVDYRYQLTCDQAVMNAYRRTMAWVREQGGLHYDEDAISAVKVPTLVVSGREDAVVPLHESLRFHELLEHSRLYALPRCGHWAMIEHPAEFARISIDFLAAKDHRDEFD